MRLSEPATKIWMKIDACYRWLKCRPMTLASGDIRFMWIFAEIPFSAFSLAIFWKLQMRPALLYSNTQSVIGFSEIQNACPWMTLTGRFALNSVIAQVWLAETDFLAGWLSKSNCVKTNKDRHILSAVQIFGKDSSFWRYKVCADIRSGSLERRR